ncbi:HAD-superfamily hydrolase [Linderina pennispora]|uniref:HAD-superfamily hydrolase n=1 Tax=Linderina pennispora TaxID=61395 RepID=A0A1Y1VY52_9FUNG|nr:HAD-superfamily hydrolase [Linderina pennispora]ORX66163.1 HAD-superfamily hydrolase [Linderina pennispora]
MNIPVKRLRNIRLVTFDLFDTLYTPAESISTTYMRPLLKHGIKVDELLVNSSFRAAFKQVHSSYPNYGYHQGITSKQWWTMVIESTWTLSGVDLANYPALAQECDMLIERFNTADGYCMFPEVPKVLKHLKRRGIKLGVISNMDEGGEAVLKALGIREHFDFVLQSIKVGVEKPDERIFTMALKAVNVPAYDALHIGDNEQLDYDAARDAGMEALVVERRNPSKVAGNPDKYIASLEDILQRV